MSVKHVVPRELARQDIEQAVDYYAREVGPEIALGFVRDLEQAFLFLAENPASGSPRYGFELDIDELRGWPLKRHPYLIFYMDREDHVDVWRILHAQRDLPQWLRAPAS
ncbi:plasmid stabilization protein [Agaricicola taiwanensis]|uniref:Plasmid stabilization protein n=1 Tax=Agaricicola taiwanensis TaxID=591372 RepID=A0A8J3DYG9_9RHOB|nr:type II toxin-antitoxin system RelE/ParE family toxin [Agaricicola taiwanensis]GGE53475.1 plasmid stabilization protein [Agaricicola taiwanensis]